LLKLQDSEGPNERALEVAVRVTNCFFQASMPDWQVECSSEERGKVLNLTFQECVERKFQGMRYAVLGMFQGYLAHLPLHHRQMLFLASLRSHTETIFDHVDRMRAIQLRTMQAQTMALDSLQNDVPKMFSSIEHSLGPLLDIFPAITSADTYIIEAHHLLSETRSLRAKIVDSLHLLAPIFATLSTATTLVSRYQFWLSAIFNSLVVVLVYASVIPTSWGVVIPLALILVIPLITRLTTTPPADDRLDLIRRLSEKSERWRELHYNAMEAWNR
jgi:hypothetical protein